MVLEGSAWFGGADRSTDQLFNFCFKIKKDVSGERLDLALTLVFDVLTMQACLRRREFLPTFLALAAAASPSKLWIRMNTKWKRLEYWVLFLVWWRLFVWKN